MDVALAVAEVSVDVAVAVVEVFVLVLMVVVALLVLVLVVVNVVLEVVVLSVLELVVVVVSWYVCMYVCMYVCIFTYINTYMHACTHTYMHTLHTHIRAKCLSGPSLRVGTLGILASCCGAFAGLGNIGELLVRPRACRFSGFGSVFEFSAAAPGELLVRPRACRFPGFGIHAYIHTYIERQIRPYTHSHIIRIHITSTIHTYRRAFAQACASAWVGCLFFYRLRMDARRPMSAGSLVKFGNSSYSNQATVVKNAFGNLKTKANPRGA